MTQQARPIVEHLDVMIVGAQKAGTSSLLAYLGVLPDVRTQLRAEMTSFTDPALAHLDREQWSKRYFGAAPPDARVTVGKLAGLMYAPAALDRLREHSPDVQVAVMLRDPVARAYSAFCFCRARGREPFESFADALADDGSRFGNDDNSRRICQYVEHGLYAEHLHHIGERFPADRVHVMLLEDFMADAREEMSPLARAAGLDPAQLPQSAPRANEARASRSRRLAAARWGPVGRAVKRVVPFEVRNRIRDRHERVNEVAAPAPPLDAETERWLRSRFAEPNQRLSALLNRDLDEVWGPRLP